MAQALREEQYTPADELRELLTQNEKLVTNLRGSGAAALNLLDNMDRIAELWPQLEAAGADLRPEEGRYETLEAQVRRHASAVLAEAVRSGGLAAARRKRYGTGEAPWWWQLDALVREARLAWLRKTAIGVAAVVLIGAALVFALNKLFPTDPKVAAATSKQMSGQQDIEGRGDYQSALVKFQEAVNLTPDDPEPWLWLGVTQEKLGNQAEATRAFDKATVLLGDELQMRLMRAPVYQSFGELDAAEADLQAVLAANPDDARAHYYLAGVYEAQGRMSDAATELETTSNLSDAQNQAELTAMARYRLAMLLQQMQSRSLDPSLATEGAGTPTPTAAP